ncbi:fibrous sheath CABYR-binding protein-like [Portunus trituberculatus]|uniref:fibrous sheath CABYR-binding protein-like n=1 Tax=Portunus trituberculatus TaxID=210409 RepID=UPI001E1CD1E0|nr:fibrous sheath CABYR-binding protein-like [Portunus trituberculatus]
MCTNLGRTKLLLFLLLLLSVCSEDDEDAYWKMSRAYVVLSVSEAFEDEADQWLSEFEEKPPVISARELSQQDQEAFWQTWEEEARAEQDALPPQPVIAARDFFKEEDNWWEEDAVDRQEEAPDTAHTEEGRVITAKEFFREDECWWRDALQDAPAHHHLPTDAVPAKDFFADDTPWWEEDKEKEEEEEKKETPQKAIPASELFREERPWWEEEETREEAPRVAAKDFLRDEEEVPWWERGGDLEEDAAATAAAEDEEGSLSITEDEDESSRMDDYEDASEGVTSDSSSLYTASEGVLPPATHLLGDAAPWWEDTPAPRGFRTLAIVARPPPWTRIPASEDEIEDIPEEEAPRPPPTVFVELCEEAPSATQATEAPLEMYEARSIQLAPCPEPRLHKSDSQTSGYESSASLSEPGPGGAGQQVGPGRDEQGGPGEQVGAASDSGEEEGSMAGEEGRPVNKMDDCLARVDATLARPTASEAGSRRAAGVRSEYVVMKVHVRVPEETTTRREEAPCNGGRLVGAVSHGGKEGLAVGRPQASQDVSAPQDKAPPIPAPQEEAHPPPAPQEEAPPPPAPQEEAHPPPAPQEDAPPAPAPQEEEPPAPEACPPSPPSAAQDTEEPHASGEKRVQEGQGGEDLGQGEGQGEGLGEGLGEGEGWGREAPPPGVCEDVGGGMKEAWLRASPSPQARRRRQRGWRCSTYEPLSLTEYDRLAWACARRRRYSSCSPPPTAHRALADHSPSPPRNVAPTAPPRRRVQPAAQQAPPPPQRQQQQQQQADSPVASSSSSSPADPTPSTQAPQESDPPQLLQVSDLSPGPAGVRPVTSPAAPQESDPSPAPQPPQPRQPPQVPQASQPCSPAPQVPAACTNPATPPAAAAVPAALAAPAVPSATNAPNSALLCDADVPAEAAAPPVVGAAPPCASRPCAPEVSGDAHNETVVACAVVLLQNVAFFPTPPYLQLQQASRALRGGVSGHPPRPTFSVSPQ